MEAILTVIGVIFRLDVIYNYSRVILDSFILQDILSIFIDRINKTQFNISVAVQLTRIVK